MNKLNLNRSFLFLTLLILAACSSSDDPEPDNILSGTQWEAFLFTSLLDNEDVYRVLRFTSNTEVESFAYEGEITNILNDVETLSYDLIDNGRFTITASSGEIVAGTIDGNSLTLEDLRYTKK